MARKTISTNVEASSAVRRFAELVKSRQHAVMREVLIESGKRLVERSPVGDPTKWHPPRWPKGYVPGHFINNWQLGIGSRPVGIIPQVDASGRGSLGRLAKVGRWPAGKTYYFTNNLPYAYKLETGWSSQSAPGGMVGLLKREWKQLVSDAVKRVRSGNVTTED